MQVHRWTIKTESAILILAKFSPRIKFPLVSSPPETTLPIWKYYHIKPKLFKYLDEGLYPHSLLGNPDPPPWEVPSPHRKSFHVKFSSQKMSPPRKFPLDNSFLAENYPWKISCGRFRLKLFLSPVLFEEYFIVWLFLKSCWKSSLHGKFFF